MGEINEIDCSRAIEEEEKEDDNESVLSEEDETVDDEFCVNLSWQLVPILAVVFSFLYLEIAEASYQENNC